MQNHILKLIFMIQKCFFGQHSFSSTYEILLSTNTTCQTLVAQSVECLTSVPGVLGSIPGQGDTLCGYFVQI